MRGRWLVPVTALTLLASGCASRSQPDAAGSAADTAVPQVAVSPIAVGSASQGNEGVPKVPDCPITSNDPVAQAFDAVAGSFTVRSTGQGNESCVFSLTKTLGGAKHGVVVSITEDDTSSRSEVAQTQRDVPGAHSVSGIGSAAFYVPDTSTLQFVQGGTTVVMQASYDIGAGTQYAAQIESSLITLSQSIAATL